MRCYAVQAHISGSQEDVRKAYLPALRGPLLRPLRERGADGIEEVIAQMDAYSLSKDDFDAIMELQLLPPGGTPDITAVPSAVKASLTRKYNQSHQAGFHKVAGTRAASERYTEGGGDEEDSEEEEDRLIQKAKPKAKAAAKGKGKGKARA
jgi:replication factor C subunit 1